MDYQLWRGDCLEEMDRIEDGSIDCILCDLPYNVTNCHWDTLIPFEPLWKQYKRVIKRNGAVVLFGSQPFTSLLVMSNLEWFKYEVIWEKSKATGFLDARRKPMKEHENIVIFSDGQCTYNPQMQKGRLHVRNPLGGKKTEVYGDFVKSPTVSDEFFPRTIIRVKNSYYTDGRQLHPTQKPVALLSYLIKTYTNEGETVLDNTFGSCSTGEAALRTGRRFIGIEKDAGYFEIGKTRMQRIAAELRGELNHLPMFAEAVAI